MGANGERKKSLVPFSKELKSCALILYQNCSKPPLRNLRENGKMAYNINRTNYFKT